MHCGACFKGYCDRCKMVGFCSLCKTPYCEDCRQITPCSICDEQFCENCRFAMFCDDCGQPFCNCRLVRFCDDVGAPSARVSRRIFLRRVRHRSARAERGPGTARVATEYVECTHKVTRTGTDPRAAARPAAGTAFPLSKASTRASQDKPHSATPSSKDRASRTAASKCSPEFAGVDGNRVRGPLAGHRLSRSQRQVDLPRHARGQPKVPI